MSYINPNVPQITNPVGVDKIIQDIQLQLSAGLTWLEKSFGRAWLFQEKDTSGKVSKMPKCYVGKGEYVNVLPNDNFKSMSFIFCKDKEKNEGFNASRLGSHKKRDLSIIIWGNLKKIDSTKTYIFTEELKKEVEKILIGLDYICSMNSYVDEKAESVFEGFTINDVDTQYLMHPYFACRFDFTVGYFDTIC